MHLNLNDKIKVKLTEHGKDIYYHQYDRVNTAFGREVCKPSYPEVDEDGYTTFQLWYFMELYGVHIGMTLPNVIEPLDILFDAPIIEPEYKAGHWKRHNTYHGDDVSGSIDPDWRCSECGGQAEVNAWCMYDLTDFCPHCGADIRGEE